MVDFNRYNKNKQYHKNPFDTFSLSIGGKSKNVGLDDDFTFDTNDSTNKIPIEDNQIRLLNGIVITLNDEQFNGIKKIREWLKNRSTFFTLSGHAGSGKSTIIKKILDEYHRGVVVSAPTHKAKHIIAKITNREGKTLHSLLGLRPDINLDEFDPNRPQFTPIVPPKITDYNLCIIDEASMINKDLYELIKEKTKNGYTKVLFMGDSAQIPPIGEKRSVVFDDFMIESHVLTKVERQQGSNPLLLIYDNMRDNLETIDGGVIRKTNMNDVGEGVIFTVDKKMFRNSVLEKFTSDEYKKNIDYCKGLAWRNETVMVSNKIVRNAIFGENKDIVNLNEVLMGYRTITNDTQTAIIIQNSADYRVVEKSELIKNAYEITGFNVKLREEQEKGIFTFQDVFIVDSDNHENLHRYAEMHDFLRDMAKCDKKLWKKYYTFRRNNLLMVNIDKHRDGQYRNSSDIIVKDIDWGYFITVHKSQGSTYEHVMISEQDIKVNDLIKERNQIFYVAISRPSVSAIVLTTKIDL